MARTALLRQQQNPVCLAVTDMIAALFQADAELRARVVRQVVQDGTIPRLKERLDKLRKEAVDGDESPATAA